jgi:hypothetical protein
MSDPAPATPTPSAPVDPTLNTPAPAPVAGDPPSNPAPAADPAPAAPPAGDPPPAAGDWPSDWRDKYAGGDEKKLKIAQGIKEPLPADAPPEVVARWREDNGIPQTPDGYKMPDGVVLGENDKPLVDDFLKTAHERNWSPDQVQTAVSWFMERQAAQADAIAARDVEARMQFEDELRSEYGPQYRQEVKRAVEFLRTAPEGLDEKLMGGRLADGTPIGNSPEVIRWLNSLQREMYPAATVVPGAGTNAVQAIEAELASLQKMSGDRSSEYWKGPMAAKHQARALELISAQQKTRQRAA